MASMKIVLVPAKADVNVIFTVTVTAFPEPVVLYELPLMLHWLFCKVPLLPSVAGPNHALPASFIKYTAF